MGQILIIKAFYNNISDVTKLHLYEGLLLFQLSRETRSNSNWLWKQVLDQRDTDIILHSWAQNIQLKKQWITHLFGAEVETSLCFAHNNVQCIIDGVLIFCFKWG